MTCALRRTYEIEDERRGPISVSRHAGKACVEPDCAFREPITISREERATPIADRLAAAAKELVRELEQRAQRREGDLSTVVRGRTHVAAVDLPERFCAVPGCKTRCRPAHLMCLPHWLRVPKALQRAVLRAFVPGQESGPAQSTEAAVGPYELQDFHLYYILRFGYLPRKVAFLAWNAWQDRDHGRWPDIPVALRHQYDIAAIKKWLKVFLWRFFQISQYKRSAMPNGPKVGSGGSLSPRSDYRAPSDGESAVWLADLDTIPEKF